MNRRTFLQATTSTVALLACKEGQGGMGAEEVLSQAKERIGKHRKGAGVIVVRGVDGKGIPNATVKVEQVRHDFLFGCNFFMFARCGDPQREEEYRQRFKALLNYATLGFYWAGYERERGKPQYEYTDQVVEWCQQNGITCKGHPLAWDHPASSPGWLPDDLKEVERLSTARVRDIISRFKGRIDIWDVVNEPTDLKRFSNKMNTWAQQMGAVPFTRLHLKVARAANPQATLLVNDYRVDPPYHRILSELREDDKLLFDAIGIQSHMHGGGWRLGRVWEVCDFYGQLGVPIHFTETTVVSGPRVDRERWGPTTPEGEEAQADYVPKFYTMLFAHPVVQAITWWDFSDLGAWQGAPAGWLRKDMTPKPVYERLMSLIRGEWWTKTEGRTDAKGEFATQAFYGTHRLTAQLPNGRVATKEVHWERGKENRFEVVVG